MATHWSPLLAAISTLLGLLATVHGQAAFSPPPPPPPPPPLTAPNPTPVKAANFRTYCGTPDVTIAGSLWKGRSYVKDGKAKFFTTSRPVRNAGTLLPVYQTICEAGTFEYNFPVNATGEYQVTLYGAEAAYAEAGWRTFNVICGGGLVLVDVDWVRIAGAQTAATRTFTCTVTSINGGGLNVAVFTTSFQGLPVHLSGVSVSKVLTSGPRPPPPSAPPINQSNQDYRVDYFNGCSPGCFNGQIRYINWFFQEGDGSDFGLDSWGDGGLQCFVNATDTAYTVPLSPTNPTQDHALRLAAHRDPAPTACKNKKGPSSQRLYRAPRMISNFSTTTWKGNWTAARGISFTVPIRFPNGPLPKGWWFSIGVLPESEVPSGKWPSSPGISMIEMKGDRLKTIMHFQDANGDIQERSTDVRFTPKSDELKMGTHYLAFEFTPWYMRGALSQVGFDTTWGYWPSQVFNTKDWQNPDEGMPWNVPIKFMLQIGIGGSRGGPVDPNGPSSWMVDMDFIRVDLAPLRDRPRDPGPVPQQPPQPVSGATPVARLYCGATPFTEPSTGHVFTRQYITGADYTSTPRHVFNSGTLDGVYKTECNGKNIAVGVPITAGSYLVTVLAAELMLNGPAQREFEIWCEGKLMIQTVDLVSDAGPRQAWSRAFYCKTSDTVLNLNFIARTYLAKFAGIIVQPAGIANVPPSPPVLTPPPPTLSGALTELWRDDFLPCGAGEANCVNGGIRTSTWTLDIGTGKDYGLAAGWGKGQQQCFTKGTDVLQVVPNGATDGILQIKAVKASVATACADKSGSSGSYLWRSGRLISAMKRSFMWTGTETSFRSVFFEVRLKLPNPTGKGFWPLAGLLPEPNNPAACSVAVPQPNACQGRYGEWPKSGEVAIVEAAGGVAGTRGSLSVQSLNPNPAIQTLAGSALPSTPSDTFHTYGLEWSPLGLRFYIDDAATTVAQVPPQKFNQYYFPFSSNSAAPFDQAFHMVLSLAVGGTYPGNPDSTTPSATTMQVDWIRVLQGPQRTV